MAKSPLDQMLDLFVYAPLGLALSAREAVPQLIDKGREQFSGQATTARMMGQMAVAQGQREAEKAISQATERLAGLGLRGERRGPMPSEAPEEPAPAPAEPASSEPAPSEPGTSEPDTAVRPSAVPTEELAIPGYDALSAPQVVQRLAGLSSEELEAVRAYEAATRHRKTILTRISQLQSDRP